MKAECYSTAEVKFGRHSSPELGSPSTWLKNRTTRQPDVPNHYPSSPPATQCDIVDATPKNAVHRDGIASDTPTEEGCTDVLAAMQAAHFAELLRLGEAHEIELRSIRTAFVCELQQRRNDWTAQKTLTDAARERYSNERKRRLTGEKLLEVAHSDIAALRKQISDICGCGTGTTKRRRVEHFSCGS